MAKRECWKEGCIGGSMALRQRRGLDNEEMRGLSVVYIKVWSSWVTA